MKRVAFLGGAAAAAVLGAVPAAAASLEARVAAVAHRFPGVLGVCARTMAENSVLVATHAGRRFPTASVIKVLIMTTAYAADEATPGALAETITFRESELIGGSDFMSSAHDGQRFTVKELIVPMITVSDNTAANLLIGHFGVAAINATGVRAGMARTRLARKFLDYAAIGQRHDNLSTPADMAQLLYVIERGAREDLKTIVTPRHCRAMVEIMLRQTDRDGIPAALPAGTHVANKTGEIEGTRNDIAIVEPFGDSPFVLAIMTQDVYDYNAAYAAIHAVTAATYRAAAGTFT